MPCQCNCFEAYEEPDVSQLILDASVQYAQMPFMITNAQKEKLRLIGYDEEAISKMTPE